MTVVDYTLRSPSDREEWIAYHAIRRKVLFENRGEVGVYIENHPDDFEPGRHPLVLVHKDATIGVIRVDVTGRVAWFRRVAIREDLQRCGHGRTLLWLAEAFAREQGCNEVRSDVAVDAVGFYERCGYTRHFPTDRIDSVPMRKSFA
jgi:GNAT superfamily N-acetyltransferase